MKYGSVTIAKKVKYHTICWRTWEIAWTKTQHKRWAGWPCIGPEMMMDDGWHADMLTCARANQTGPFFRTLADMLTCNCWNSKHSPGSPSPGKILPWSLGATTTTPGKKHWWPGLQLLSVVQSSCVWQTRDEQSDYFLWQSGLPWGHLDVTRFASAASPSRLTISGRARATGNKVLWSVPDFPHFLFLRNNRPLTLFDFHPQVHSLSFKSNGQFSIRREAARLRKSGYQTDSSAFGVKRHVWGNLFPDYQMITNSLGFHGAQAGLFHALGLLLIVTERTLSSIWYNFWLKWRINNLRLEWSIKVNFLNIINNW